MSALQRKIVKVQVRAQDLRLEVMHRFRANVCTVIKGLCDRIERLCHPLTLPFEVALEAAHLLTSEVLPG